jgi:(R,R)-butanediol dehydrogenase/meso-butanediol dehydrogenase/diacetyl reductase
MTSLEVGEDVIIEPCIIAAEVPTGSSDEYQLSPNMNSISLGGRGGGFSEMVAVGRATVVAGIGSRPRRTDS